MEKIRQYSNLNHDHHEYRYCSRKGHEKISRLSRVRSSLSLLVVSPSVLIWPDPTRLIRNRRGVRPTEIDSLKYV